MDKLNYQKWYFAHFTLWAYYIFISLHTVALVYQCRDHDEMVEGKFQFSDQRVKTLIFL